MTLDLLWPMFTLGFAGSVHCALMCGPLACAAQARSTGNPAAVASAYHLARVAAYTALGALLGLVGAVLIHRLSLNVTAYLPWVLAAALLGSALDVGKRLLSVPGLSGISARLVRTGAKFSPVGRATVIGAATPLLPCGLLWGAFLAAAGSGEWSQGALALWGFALGSAPAILLAQFGLGAVLRRSPGARIAIQRAVPALAAAVLVFRALTTHAPWCH